MPPLNRKATIASSLTALAIAVLAIVLSISSGGGTTINVAPTPAPNLAQTAAPAGELAAPEPLRSEAPPPGVTRQELHQDQTTAARNLVAPRPPAGAQIYSCRHAYGGHLWSSRGPIKPTEFVLHYTAGPGTAESIDSYFRRTRAASSTFILEPRGHCLQEVPLSETPWTQLAANRTSISVEIVTTGYNITRAQWLAMPIFTKGILAALMRDSMRPYGIPLRRVDPVGCNFVVGYTDHNHLECGNTHTDVLPNFPWDVLDRQLRDGGQSAIKAPSKRAIADCRGLVRYRIKRARGEHPSAGAVRLAERRKTALEKGGYLCGRHGSRAVIRRK